MGTPIKTISPESLMPQTYRLTCRGCEDEMTSDELIYLDGYGEAHVRRTGHTVVIEKREEEQG